MKRIAIGFLAMAMVLFSSSNAEATQSVHTDQEIRTYVIDSFTGDVLGQLSDLQINQDRIGFSYSEKSFMFDLQETNINSEANNNLNGARYYYGLADKLVCSVVEFNDAYCIKVTNKAESLINRKKDRETNFTIVSAGKQGNWIEEITTFLQGQSQEKQSDPERISNNLHVFVQGTSVPYLISGGSSEGWCTATGIAYEYYRVSSMIYYITCNFPTDGISLWFDPIINSCAYTSPVSPSAGLTNVSGSWAIDAATGTFMAETTVTATVNNLPISWSLYDVTDMYGVHQ